jgi:hypothetical protein
VFEGGERSLNKEPHARELDDSYSVVRSFESTAKQSSSSPASTRHAEELVEQATADGECDAEEMTSRKCIDFETKRIETTDVGRLGYMH